MTECCFDWLITDKKIACQARAMTALFHLGTEFEWIHPELQQIIEQNIHLGSAGYKARGKNTIKQIVTFQKKDLNLGDCCGENHQLRPHVVWFGEMVPMMDEAMHYVTEADVLIIVGTSMQVYPAAGLLQFASENVPIFFVDPNPSISSSDRVSVFVEKASTGVPKVITEIEKMAV